MTTLLEIITNFEKYTSKLFLERKYSVKFALKQTTHTINYKEHILYTIIPKYEISQNNFENKLCKEANHT